MDATPIDPAPAGAPVRIVYLDDDPVDHDLMRFFLRKRPAGTHELVCVSTVEDAAAALSAGGVDILLLDNRMPGVADYRGTLAMLPAIGAGTRVIVTSSEVESAALRAPDAGIDAVYEKGALRGAVRAGVFGPRKA